MDTIYTITILNKQANTEPKKEEPAQIADRLPVDRIKEQGSGEHSPPVCMAKANTLLSQVTLKKVKISFYF